jgi:4-amino-4-deoxy-L-arabinose transferase-like glycosyltransferase
MSQLRGTVLHADSLTPRQWRASEIAVIAQRVFPWALLAGVFAMLLWTRMLQPGDLHDDDQSKTMTYTVDMITNHQFAMPRDQYYQPATKPPLYNWLDVPCIYLLQSWSAFAFKLPSILAALATCGLIIYGTRVLLLGTRRRPLALPEPVSSNVVRSAIPIGAGIAAAGIFLANPTVVRMMYLCRPDMLLTAFLTGAWVCATIALLREDRPTRLLAALFWICVGGASLTKGPPALAVLIYAPIAAWLFAPDGFASLRRLHAWMALPFVVVPLAAWMTLGYIQGGTRFFHVYFVQEIFTRFAGGGPEGTEPKPWWQMATWFFIRFSPWSVLVMAAVVGLPLRKWRSHVLAPVVLWILLVLVFFSIPGSKRADYLLPMYPPAAIAAAFLLVVLGSWLGVTPTRVMLVISIVAIWVAVYPERRRVITSAPTEAFVRTLRSYVGKNDSLVMVNITGYQPLLPLMGRFTGTRPLPVNKETSEKWLAEMQSAKWVIIPYPNRWSNPVAVTNGPAPAGKDGRDVQLALYKVGAENSPTKRDFRAFARYPSAAPATRPARANRRGATP